MGNKKFIISFSVIAILTGLLLVDTGFSGKYSIYKSLLNFPQENPPMTICTFRHSCKIEHPKFIKAFDGHDADNWCIEVNNKLYKVEGEQVLDSILIPDIDDDTSDKYIICNNPATVKLGHYFKAVGPYVLPEYVDYLDYYDLYGGFYKHEKLILPYVSKSVSQIKNDDYPIYLRIYQLLHNTIVKLQQRNSETSYYLLEEYIPGNRIYINDPLLYIPFPLSNIGYLFSKEVLKDYRFITELVHDQNFYAVLAYIPSDVAKIGKIIAYDKNGVLLSPDCKRTQSMKLHLKKNDGVYYTSYVKYTRTHSRKMVTPDEYRKIESYSEQSKASYTLYDRRIFANIKHLLDSNRIYLINHDDGY